MSIVPARVDRAIVEYGVLNTTYFYVLLCIKSF